MATMSPVNESTYILIPSSESVVILYTGKALPLYSAPLIASFKRSAFRGIKVFYPSLKYCGDNAAMIAFVGSLRSSDKIKSQASYVRARWPLSELNK